jgi:hypothetical protein
LNNLPMSRAANMHLVDTEDAKKGATVEQPSGDDVTDQPSLATSTDRNMSMMDRDWYREEVAKRLRQISGTPSYIPSPATKLKKLTKRHGLWLAVTLVAVVLAVPLTLTSRCDQGSWLSEPVACWQYSWCRVASHNFVRQSVT